MPPLNEIATVVQAAGAPGPGAVMVPNFTLQTQQHNQWCWAAVTSSICAMYGDADTSQCNLASNYFGSCCISNPPPDDNWTCNRPNALEIALGDQNHLALGSPINGTVLFADIQGQIDNGKPVCCRIDFKAGAHFIVIVGYDPASNDVIVQDPFETPHNGNFTLAGLGAFLGGSWSYTYYVAP